MTTETQQGVQIIWEPINKPQESFVASPASRCLFSGAFGAGKTIALCAKALKLSLDYPKNYGLICRKVRATLGQTTLKTFLDRVCPRELIVDYNKSEGLVTLHNGSQILFGGLDDPLKLGSLELGWAGIDEAIETVEDDWKMLEGRLRLAGVPHQLFAATNPGPPSHYLYRIFFTEGKGEVYQASSLENPELPEDYKQRLSEFDGVYRDRYVLGLWKGLEGLVYSAFDERVCLIPRFDIDKSWLVYTGHDFGLVNPCALFYAQNPVTGDFFLFAEYLPSIKLSYNEHVKAFQVLTAGRNVLKRVGGNHQEEGERQAYTAQGWVITEPKHSQDKALQIKMVQGMHRLNKVYVFNDLSNYIREKFSFVVKEDRIPNESQFHCFVAGTKVLTIAGDKPIESIKVGDMVATREGYRQVVKAGETRVSSVVTAVFSNGVSLIGTPDHPIYVKGKGFVPLTALRYDDIMEIWEEKQLSIKEQNIIGIQRQNGGATGCISGQGLAISIVLCGKMLLKRYLRGVLSIIKTSIHSIMSYPIFKARLLTDICQSILGPASMTFHTWQRLNPCELQVFNYGLPQQRAKNNLVRELNSNGEINYQSLRYALIANKSIRQSNHLIVSSVQEDAEPHTAVSCLNINPSGKALVYNLSVEDIPEYYANGILVHNCMSAERYLLSEFIPETVEVLEEMPVWRY